MLTQFYRSLSVSISRDFTPLVWGEEQWSQLLFRCTIPNTLPVQKYSDLTLIDTILFTQFYRLLITIRKKMVCLCLRRPALE